MDGRLDDLKDVHQTAAEPVLGEARSLVPVVTGTLRDTLRLDRRAAGASIIAGRNRIPYAGVIHFGWPARNIEPQPFLYDALDARQTEVAAAYAVHVKRLRDQLDRETPDS